jgi:hypothetical protein
MSMADPNGGRITFWRNVCGCTLGGWSAIVAIACCIIAAPLPGAALWARVAASVGIVLAAALTGKFVALVVARAVLATLTR